MESKTRNFFIVNTRGDKEAEDGRVVKDNEVFVVDAVSWSDCEIKVTSEVNSNNMEITAIKKAKFKEVFFAPKGEGGCFYTCGVSIITIDEKTSKERRTKFTYLVEAASLGEAKKNIDSVFKNSMLDYTISTINETSISDVI